MLTVQGAVPRDADFKQHLRTDIDGFSLHAAVRCAADDRQALEQLCRYITRPPCKPRPASGRTFRQAQTVHRTVCAYQAPKFSIEEIVPRQFGDCAVYENFIAELLAAASPEAQ
jgi:hypothetical protein